MKLDSCLQQLVERSKETLGLDAYEFYTSHIHMEQGVNGFLPVFCMEWLPKGVEMNREEGFNPEGTAVVEVDLRSKRLRRIIFVGGTSYADKLRFSTKDEKELIHWLEQTTGLAYDRHFRLQVKADSRYVFQSHCDGIPIVPAGRIEAELDEQGRITLFSVYGDFPDKSLIRVEEASLSFDHETELLAYEQFKLATVPLAELNKWVHVYALEEILVSPDKKTWMPYPMGTRMEIPVQQVLEWKEPLHEAFERKPLYPRRDGLTFEQALKIADESTPFVLSEQNRIAVAEKVTAFLRMKFPQDSGKWMLKTISRDEMYLIAELEPTCEDEIFPLSKMRVFLDPEHLEVINYIDKMSFVNDMFASCTPPEPVAVTKEEAFRQIKDHISLSPVYVYDAALRQYRLYGKLDCSFGIMADNGRVVELEELGKTNAQR